MDDETRQIMLEAARTKVKEKAREKVENLFEEARNSAEITLKGVAQGMGFDQVIFSPLSFETAA